MPSLESRRPHLLTLFAWLPVLVWACLIWHLGGDAWHALETSRLIGPLIRWLLPDLDPAQHEAIALAIRKLAHPTVYGLLAGLSLRALQRSTHWRFVVTSGVALLGVSVLALADEARQVASGLRTGSIGDVALDVAGGLLVLALAAAAQRALGRRLFPAI